MSYFPEAKRSLVPNWHSSTLDVARKPGSQPELYQIAGRNVALISIYNTDGQPICQNARCADSNDPQAKELYAAIVKTYTFFKDYLKYVGIDGKGEIAPFELHWANENAAWMCEGTASGQQCLWSFNDHFLTEKIVTHEWTHGIIARRSPLAPTGQPAALNEALADIMAISCYLWNHGGNIRENAVWRIEGIRDLTEHNDFTNYKSLRNGENPSDKNDYGYIHENSKIISHAYFQVMTLLTEKTRDQNKALNISVAVIWGAMPQMQFNETFNGFALKAIRFANQTSADIGQTFAEAFLHVRLIKYEIPHAPVDRLQGPTSPRRQQSVIRVSDPSLLANLRI